MLPLHMSYFWCMYVFCLIGGPHGGCYCYPKNNSYARHLFWSFVHVSADFLSSIFVIYIYLLISNKIYFILYNLIQQLYLSIGALQLALEVATVVVGLYSIVGLCVQI